MANMIQANHQKWADLLFRPYIFWLMKHSFSRIELHGTPPGLSIDQPMVLLANHSSWWDGFLVYLLNKKIFHRKLYLMMLEDQLQRYSFFKKLGAYGIDPGKPKSVAESIQYTLERLTESQALVTIFPQGELRPWHQRPLAYKRLPDLLAKKFNGPLFFLQVAIRLEFQKERKPVALVQTGKLWSADENRANLSGQLEQEMSDLLNKLLSKDKETEFTILLQGYRGLSDR